MGFIENLDNEIKDEKKLTENGAIGYVTTGKNLLDLNFLTSSLRNESEEKIIEKFKLAFFDDKILALKWLFFASDVREGMGERRLFRVIFKWLATDYPEYAKALISIVSEYSRWDNIFCLLDTELKDEVITLCKEQLESDMERMEDKMDISLLAKWMPSINASSYKTRRYAKIFADGFGMSDKQYRKMLSSLRAHLDVIEVKTSSNRWSEINYSAVPSKANLKYEKAFLKHDNERRNEYLQALKNGDKDVKINSSVLFPCDIVSKYNHVGYNETLEQLWKALPEYGNDNTIVVADGSGSMTWDNCGNTNVKPIDVANSIAIYFSEHATGEFKNKYITFSSRPRLVDFSKADSLYDKIQIAENYNECSNTNIEAVFNLILNTAIKNEMKQEDIPKNILIISDMEFDSGVDYCDNWNALFDNIQKKYEDNGYKLPRLIFWNVNSRTGTIPMQTNKNGIALLSGYSINILDMVLSGKLDPFECLKEKLNSERYIPVYEALENII